MKSLNAFVILLLVALVSGCSTGNLAIVEPEVTPPAHVVEQAERPLICNGREQCALYWQRAEFYVNQHAVYKVQTSTDTIIQTFSPGYLEPYLGYNISKEPLGSGSYRIWVKVWCGNRIGCVPNKLEEIARMKGYITGGQ